MITIDHILEADYEAMYLHFYGVMEFQDPAPNKMFGPLEHLITKFVRPQGGEKWTCARCGRKRGRQWLWTLLVPFRACTTAGFSLDHGPLFEPLTPVCADHPLCAWPAGEDAEF